MTNRYTCCCTDEGVECLIHSTIASEGKPFPWSVISGSPVFNGSAVEFNGAAVVRANHDETLNLNVTPPHDFTWNKHFRGVVQLDSVDAEVRLTMAYNDANNQQYIDFFVRDYPGYAYPIVWIGWVDIVGGSRTNKMLILLDEWTAGYQIFFTTYAVEPIDSTLIFNGCIQPLNPNKISGNPYYVAANGEDLESQGLGGRTTMQLESIAGESKFLYLKMHHTYSDPANEIDEPARAAHGCPEKITIPSPVDEACYHEGVWRDVYDPGSGLRLVNTHPSAVELTLPTMSGDPCCPNRGGDTILVFTNSDEVNWCVTEVDFSGYECAPFGSRASILFEELYSPGSPGDGFMFVTGYVARLDGGGNPTSDGRIEFEHQIGGFEENAVAHLVPVGYTVVNGGGDPGNNIAFNMCVVIDNLNLRTDTSTFWLNCSVPDGVAVPVACVAS